MLWALVLSNIAFSKKPAMNRPAPLSCRLPRMRPPQTDQPRAPLHGSSPHEPGIVRSFEKGTTGQPSEPAAGLHPPATPLSSVQGSLSEQMHQNLRRRLRTKF